MPRPLPLLTIVFAIAACSPSQGRQVPTDEQGTAGYPTRLALTGIEQPVDQAPLQPEGGQWQISADRLTFAVPGQQPLLSISCQHDGDGSTSLRLVRVTRAEAGAKALFALIGNGRIARLPLNALEPGEAGRWEGSLRAIDPRLDVLKGGNAIEATLPGGGTLKLPASAEPGRLLAACRASDTTGQGPAVPASPVAEGQPGQAQSGPA